jgi:crotonobetainyl-CoA:carnitine CoA-transferase CaiB-like acyl-CoA transferase
MVAPCGSALHGVRVLDASTGIGGPLAAMLLGDLGAEVIRLEQPGNPDSELPGAVMWSRNKTIVRAEADDPKIRSLAAGADLVLTSSDMTAIRLGLDPTASFAPRLIHLSMPPFAQGLYASTADAFTAAWCGIARRQCSSSGGPVEPIAPYLSYLHGIWGATVGIATLVERVRSGRGQRVIVDAVHGALIGATTYLAIDPEDTPPATTVGPAGPNPAFSIYRAGDGQFLFLGALAHEFQRTAFRLLGVSDIFDDPRIAGNGDLLYSPLHRGWVRARLNQAFLARGRDEWLRLFAENDCPASPLLEREEWLDHPQMQALRQKCVLVDPVVGTATMPCVPIDFEGTPVPPPSARHYSDRVEWRSPTLPLPAPVPAAQARSGGPLHGFRMIDLGTVLAGPYAGMLLAALGANVVKAETLAGDAFRVRGFMHNRGQRSLALDLRHEQGHEIFLEMIRQTDAVIDNFRPGVLARLGIDHRALAAVNPRIICTSITAYGSVGPLAGQPGFDPVIQALSGMMTAQGGEQAPTFSTMPVTDVGSAAVAALAVVAALFSREQTGRGQRAETTLASVAAFMQSGELVAYRNRTPPRTGVLDDPGPTPLSRHYPTADGYVRVHFDSAEQLAHFTPAQDIAGRLASLATDQAIALLKEAGVQVVPSRTFEQVVRDPDALEAGYVTPVHWPDGRTTFVPGRYARFSRTPTTPLRSPPGLGQHSREILVEFGLAAARIDALVADGVVGEGGPMQSVANVGYR